MNAVVFLAISLIVVYCIFHVALLLKSRRMKKRERQFLDNGIKPYGSGLCHGMVLANDGKSVKHDQKKSDSWYSRLA